MNTTHSAALVAPPPPAKRGLISGGFLAGILAAFFLTVAPSAEAQTERTLTLSAINNNGDRDPSTPELDVDEGDRVSVTLTLSSPLSNGAVTLNMPAFSGTATPSTGDIEFSSFSFSVILSLTDIRAFNVVDDSIPEPDETVIISVPTILSQSSTDTIIRGDPITITIRQNDGYVAPVVPGPTVDNPTARSERLDAPVGAVGRGVGLLAAEAVTKRLHTVATANQLNLGRATTVDDLLRQSGFNLTGDGGGRGFNFWGSGDFVSAEGDHDGVDYDGDTSAFTVGIDTNWRDGLIGVAVARSDGDVDFTVKADGMKSTLETTVTSMHPYLTRRLNRSQLWLTAGHGSGDAELKESDALIKTDITVTTAAFGITHKRGDLFTGGLSALYSRAKLDAVTAAGKTLPATTADSIRITANAETGWTHGAWRPFLSFALRHDSGDGDTGGAFDLGGGVEYQTPTVLVRLAGSGHIQGQGTDEQRATLTVRKSTGDFDLSLNLAADDSGLDTARLLTGEWRF